MSGAFSSVGGRRIRRSVYMVGTVFIELCVQKKIDFILVWKERLPFLEERAPNVESEKASFQKKGVSLQQEWRLLHLFGG